MPPDVRTMYKADPASIYIEALAQRQLRYLQIGAEAAQYVSSDPTRRNQSFASLQENPMLTEMGAQHLVPLGDDPDVYLDVVDEMLNRTPETFDDHVPQLQQINLRVHELHDTWFRTIFAPMHGIQVGEPLPGPSAPAAPLPTSPQSPLATTPVTRSKIEELVQSPTRLLNLQFNMLATEDADRPWSNAWRVVSVNHTIARIEYKVLFDHCGDASISMAEGELRSLLADSCIVLPEPVS
ncbi:hypothetical protein C8R44DRAFT_811422 [Mycena epipterygia]|nr:hypothetical protein C8R44DRAFT_811422 [Mycena epipterygia]